MTQFNNIILYIITNDPIARLKKLLNRYFFYKFKSFDVIFLDRKMGQCVHFAFK